MDQKTEQTVEDLINHLSGQLSAKEDVAAAIDVYKTANWIISRLDDVKQHALNLAENDLRLNNQTYLKSASGSAGWTEPKARILNEKAWEEAVRQNPQLHNLQREYEVAQALIQKAQEPYMETPEGSFFIR